MSRKAIWLISAVFLCGALIVGYAYLNSSAPENTNTDSDNSSNSVQQEEQGNDSSVEDHLSGANRGETVDARGLSRVEIAITDFEYEITDLTISPETTVVWTNEGQVQHDVVHLSSPTQFESALLSQGETYEYTFSEEGVYLYICSPHESQMRAAITVAE